MDILPDDAPAPRLCHLIKWPDFDGYGFNLHAERSNPGQFIGKIDDESPAQMAGLREGDKIIEVNGVNISNENHRQVVERIKADPQETKLLVVDQETDLWYKEQDIVIKSSQINVVYVKTPYPRPLPDSPRAKFHQQQSSVSGETNTTPATTDTGSSIAHSTDNQQQQQVSLSPSMAGESSLETSDFNEDSIEQQQVVKKQQQQQQEEAALKSADESPIQQTSVLGNKPSPPMSPDSGKGDEEPANVVTIEAEINRQSPQKQQLMKANDDDDEDVDEDEQDFKREQQDEGGAKSISNSIEPDSLSGQSSKKSPPSSYQVSKQFDFNIYFYSFYKFVVFMSSSLKRCCAIKSS